MSSTRNILQSSATYITIPVNCAGVMGAGLALAARNASPQMYKAYKAACYSGKINIGRIALYDRFILFPTKQHWRDPSQLSYIEDGMRSLVDHLVGLQEQRPSSSIITIALPKLGCGLGGLKWEDVSSIVSQYAIELDKHRIHLLQY